MDSVDDCVGCWLSCRPCLKMCTVYEYSEFERKCEFYFIELSSFISFQFARQCPAQSILFALYSLCALSFQIFYPYQSFDFDSSRHSAAQ